MFPSPVIPTVMSRCRGSLLVPVVGMIDLPSTGDRLDPTRRSPSRIDCNGVVGDDPGGVFVDVVDDAGAIFGDERGVATESIPPVVFWQFRSITPFVFHTSFTHIYSLCLQYESANLQHGGNPNYVMLASRSSVRGVSTLAPA